MSNPPNNYNTNTAFNKFKGTYFNSDIDVSGGDIISRTGNLYLAPNSSIFTSDNQIQFNEEFQFCDFINNVNVLGQLRNTYNSISYDVGYELTRIQDIYDNKIGTMSYYQPSDFNLFNNIYCQGQIQYQEAGTGTHIDLVPIVLDSKSKLTNVTFASNTTTFTGLLSFPSASIASSSINNLLFVPNTGVSTIAGVKTFSSAPVLSGASITALTIPVGSVVGTALNLTTANQAITSTKIFQVAQTFQNNLRLDGSLLVGSLGTTIITNANLVKISFISTATSDLQTQINSINAVTLSASNVFTGTSNQFSNTLRLDGALNLNANALVIPNTTLQKLQYISTISSDIQTQTNTNATNITTANTNITTANTNITTANTNITTLTTKLTDISYASSITTIANTLASSTFTFSTTINGTTKAIFDNILLYCNSLSSNVQTSLTNNTTNISTLTTKLTDVSFASSTTTIANTLASSTFTFSTTINGATKTVFDNVMLYCNTLSGNVQTALTNLSYSVNPVATIIMSVMSDIQTTSSNKYLLCDGQSVGRSSYPNLFAKIGTTFGSADPFSFNVPNYQGAFLRGYGQSMINGQIYEGNYSVNLPQQDAIQEHNHWGQQGSYCGTNRVSGITNAFASGAYFPGTYNFDQTGLQSTGRSDSGETRPMNYSVFYYIKS